MVDVGGDVISVSLPEVYIMRILTMRLCLDHHAFILFLVQIVVSPDGNSYKFNRRDSDGAYADPFYAYPQCILKQPCESQTQQGMLSALYPTVNERLGDRLVILWEHVLQNGERH